MRRDRGLQAAVAVLGTFVVVSLVAGLLPLDGLTNHLDARLQPPSSLHWLGTDDNGRDVMHRLLLGGRWSLLVGLGATALALGLGVALGVAAAVARGAFDAVAGLVLDSCTCVPPVFLAAAVAAVLRPSPSMLIAVLGLASFPAVARLSRAEASRLMATEFVLAARAAGAGPMRVLARHVIPGLAWPLGAVAPVIAAGAVVGEAGLSFLGMGIPEPEPTWGQLLSLVRTYPQAWWLMAFPGTALFLLLTALNLLARRMAPGGGHPFTAARVRPTS